MNKNYILKKNHEIEDLISKKKSVGSKYYIIYYDYIDNGVHIAISASKKLGDAIVRNYQRRVTKEILRGILPQLEGMRLLLILKPSSLSLSYKEKEKQIRYILAKIENKKRSNDETK